MPALFQSHRFWYCQKSWHSAEADNDSIARKAGILAFPSLIIGFMEAQTLAGAGQGGGADDFFVLGEITI
jgi:hypothetical protein